MEQDTFSSTLKEELCHGDIQNRTEAFWEAMALLKFLNQRGRKGKNSNPNDDLLTVKVSFRPSLMRRLFNLMKLISGSTPSINLVMSHGKARRARIQAGLNASMSGDIPKIPYAAETLKRHRDSRRGFLRGVFLARGYVSSPQKNHHLEMSLPLKKDALLVKALLEKEGLKPKIVSRRSNWVVYFKDSDDISHFMKILGASRSILEYENIRAQKELKSSVQRLVNMDGANVSRAVNAAMKQSEDIALIDSSIGLHNLPKSLRELAVLRRENPDLSMEELGELFDPPISKSAVNHRFRRISRIAQKIRDSNQGQHAR